MNTIRVSQSDLFFVQHRDVSSPKAHYLLVLNPDPASSELIVFGVVTSGIEKARNRIRQNGQSEETLVYISPSDYPPLDHDSVIDCNTPVKYSKYEFELIFGQLNARRRMSIPQEITDAVVRGVLVSDLVAERIKKTLR